MMDYRFKRRATERNAAFAYLEQWCYEAKRSTLRYTKKGKRELTIICKNLDQFEDMQNFAWDHSLNYKDDPVHRELVVTC